MSLPEVTIDPQDFGLVSIPANTSQVIAIVGVSSAGSVNAVTSWAGPNQTAMRDALGTGPLVENAAYQRSIAGGSVITCKADASTAGAVGSVTHVGTGASVLTLGASAPLDGYSVIVKISRAGAVPASGTVAFRYSLDGGTTYSGEIALPSSGLYTISGTGISLVFSAASLVVDDTYAFACTPPQASLSDVTDAIDALLADPRTWGWLHVVGAPAPALGSVVVTPAVAETPPTVAISGTPSDFVDLVLEITTGGIIGTDAVAFKLSQDGGASFAAPVAVPALTPWETALPGGLKATWAHGGTDTYVIGQKWTFNTYGAIAALFAAVDAKMTAAQNAFRYAGAILELPDASDAILLKATANLSGERIMYAGGFCELTSMTSKAGQGVRTQPAAWPLAARRGAVGIHVDLGRTLDGSLEGVASLDRDENATPALGAARIATLRTITGYPGFFAASDTNGDMMAPPGSDYSLSQYRAVMDRACTVLRAALIPYLNREIALNKKTGKILETEARAIEGKLDAALEGALINGSDGRHASACRTRIDRTEAILTTKNLSVDLAIVPLGVAKTITATVHYATNL